MYCPTCKTKNDDGSDLCSECGQALCPECGAAIDENATVCPKCGTEFELACPRCGAAVTIDAEECAECGLQFVFPCPHCGEEIDLGDDVCPHCNKAVCPECGGALGDDDTVCPKCGAKLELFCPRCRAEVETGAETCPQCGLQFVLPCPHCGKQITLGVEDCPHCGGDLCPACGGALEPDDLACPACGASFGFFCPMCATEVQPGDTECASCGTPLDTSLFVLDVPPSVVHRAAAPIIAAGAAAPRCRSQRQIDSPQPGQGRRAGTRNLPALSQRGLRSRRSLRHVRPGHLPAMRHSRGRRCRNLSGMQPEAALRLSAVRLRADVLGQRVPGLRPHLHAGLPAMWRARLWCGAKVRQLRASPPPGGPPGGDRGGCGRCVADGRMPGVQHQIPQEIGRMPGVPHPGMCRLCVGARCPAKPRARAAARRPHPFPPSPVRCAASN